MIPDELRLTAYAPDQLVIAFAPLARMGYRDHSCLQTVSRVLVEETRTQSVGDLACRRIGEDVFACDIEVLPLVGIEPADVKTNF